MTPRAFPCKGENEENDGMELRDYFAAKSLNGFISIDSTDNKSFMEIAKMAYQIADAMMNERKAIRDKPNPINVTAK